MSIFFVHFSMWTINARHVQYFNKINGTEIDLCHIKQFNYCVRFKALNLWDMRWNSSEEMLILSIERIYVILYYYFYLIYWSKKEVKIFYLIKTSFLTYDRKFHVVLQGTFPISHFYKFRHLKQTVCVLYNNGHKNKVTTLTSLKLFKYLFILYP